MPVDKGQIDTIAHVMCVWYTGEDEAFAESSNVDYEGVVRSGSNPEDNNYLTKDGPRSLEVESSEAIYTYSNQVETKCKVLRFGSPHLHNRHAISTHHFQNLLLTTMITNRFLLIVVCLFQVQLRNYTRISA